MVKILVAMAALVMTCCGHALAFRAPTSSERHALVTAFDHAHAKKFKNLFVQDIRVSTVNRRYAAVLYDLRETGFKGGVGNTTFEYFKRVAGASDRASAADVIEQFVSLGQSGQDEVPPAVRGDMNPIFNVTYTVPSEQITDTIRWTCDNGRTLSTQSVGKYKWTMFVNNVPLSLADFTSKDVGGTLSGTETIQDPCPHGHDCPGQQTINFRLDPRHSEAARLTGTFAQRLFHSGYLVVNPDWRSSGSCVLERGAAPLAEVQVPLPNSFKNVHSDLPPWTVDGSDFTEAELPNRLGHCVPFDATQHVCTETLDQFSGTVTAKLIHHIGRH